MTELPRAYHKQKEVRPSLFSAQSIFVFLFIFLLPTQYGKHFFFDFSLLAGVRVDYLAPALYVTDIFAALLVITNIKKVLLFFRNIKVQLIVFFFALIIPVARSPEIALYCFFKFIEFLSIFAVFRYLTAEENRTIFYGFFVGTILQFALVMSQFLLKHSLQGIAYYFGERTITLSMAGIAKASLNDVELLRPYGTFSHPNSLAGFYLLLFAFYLVAEHIKIRNIFRVIFLTLCSLLVLFSFSKVALITLLVINILYVVYKWEEYKDCLLCMLSRFIVPAVLIAIFLPARGDMLTIDKRIGLAGNALQIILAHPFFGVGLGNYLIAQNAYPNPYPYFFAQPVHNIVLLTVAQIGIPLSILCVMILLNARRHIRYLYVAPFITIAVLFTGMFDHYWLTLQQNIFLIAVLFALI